METFKNTKTEFDRLFVFEGETANHVSHSILMNSETTDIFTIIRPLSDPAASQQVPDSLRL